MSRADILRIRYDAALATTAVSAPLLEGLCAVIGSFDGVHQGHQVVINHALAQGRKTGRPSALITFDPHPQSFFGRAQVPFRLMRLEQQVRVVRALGVDLVLVLEFDADLAGLSPMAFVDDILWQGLKLSYIGCGFDFCFGMRGAGKAADLLRLAEGRGIAAEIVPEQVDGDGIKLASSGVREALIAGNLPHANAILGRPYAIEGIVEHGDAMGRQIGFPTLNIDPGPYQRPARGVYISHVRLSDGRVLPAVSNWGVRPTVGGLAERFETHILDFDEDLYGQSPEVALLAYLRPEMKFADFNALKAQIGLDRDQARAWFKA